MKLSARQELRTDIKHGMRWLCNAILIHHNSRPIKSFHSLEAASENIAQKLRQEHGSKIRQKHGLKNSANTWPKIFMTVIVKKFNSNYTPCSRPKNQIAIHVIVEKIELQTKLSLKNSNFDH